MRPLSLTGLRWLHVSIDTLLVSAAWLGAYGLRALFDPVLGKPINPFDWYAGALPIVVVPWITTCWWFGIYESPRMRTGGFAPTGS